MARITIDADFLADCVQELDAVAEAYLDWKCALPESRGQLEVMVGPKLSRATTQLRTVYLDRYADALWEVFRQRVVVADTIELDDDGDPFDAEILRVAEKLETGDLDSPGSTPQGEQKGADICADIFRAALPLVQDDAALRELCVRMMIDESMPEGERKGITRISAEVAKEVDNLPNGGAALYKRWQRKTADLRQCDGDSSSRT